MRKWLMIATLLVTSGAQAETLREQHERETKQTAAKRKARRVAAVAKQRAVDAYIANLPIAAGLAFGPPCGCGNNIYHRCKALSGKRINPDAKKAK